jgi:glycosyltransferase involved in cell wall biosynthesis
MKHQPPPPAGNPVPLLSFVIPVYNEAECLRLLHDSILSAVQECGLRRQFVYVNDGSTDGSLDELRRIVAEHDDVIVVNLSRNFGKEVALTAGLDHAGGDAVVVLDADLQDPPSLIPKMIDLWRNGYDIVYGKRISRRGECPLKTTTSFLFYRLMRRMSNVWIPEDTGDFRLLSRRALDAVLTMKERHRFMKGLFSWVGFRQIAVEYARNPRVAGRTKWNYWRLWNFALEGVTSFTTVPLRIVSYFGLTVSIIAVIYAIVVLYKALAFGDPVKGYPSMMIVILLLGGVQLMGIGVVGEYLGRTYEESKQRPLYLVGEILHSESASTPQASGSAPPRSTEST